MSSQVPGDDVTLLARLMAIMGEAGQAAPAEILRQIDVENMRLGAFVKDYIFSPAPAELAIRSTLREDSVLAELADLLAAYGGSVQILDGCCGLGVLPDRILQSLGSQSNRIAYVAVDRDPGCLELLRNRAQDFSKLGSFRTLLRDIWDLGDMEHKSVDLVVINNAMHEIPPRFYPDMFETLNLLLRPDRGHLCIVDMEELPADAPESVAIVWRATEIEEILRAGGFSPMITRHAKSTMVFRVRVTHTSAGINKDAMRNQIVRSLREKLAEAIFAFRKIGVKARYADADPKDWIVASGAVARLAEELDAVVPGVLSPSEPFYRATNPDQEGKLLG